MVISGFVEERKMPVVALQIFDPEGGILSANQVDIEDDNTFFKTISLDSPHYDAIGEYSISINYGQLKTEINFEIIGDSIDESFPEDDFSFLFPEILAMFSDKEVYEDGDTVTILGLVSEKDAPSVLIGIYDPFGTPAGFYFADVDEDLEFSISFLVKAGVNFKAEGFYSVSAFYGDSEVITNFEYVEQIETIEPPTNEDEEKSNENDQEEKNSNVVKEKQKEIAKQEEKTVENIPKPVVPSTSLQEKESKNSFPSKNLSVEDIELGIMLNQINLQCDKGEFVDTISYYDSMGPALIRLCKYDEAIFYYDQSLVQDPNNVDILTNKGSALAKMGFFDEAIIHYDSALTIEPKNYFALNNKGNALANLGNYEAAIISYKKALENAPSNGVITSNLEKAQKKLDNLETTTEPVKTAEPLIIEPKENLIRSSNAQEQTSIIDQIGNIFSSLFTFLS